ncbi:MAG: regulatory protein RecX [Selenomonas sp.]|nr:regulatory protein RecX [Selenomonas sp.]
MWQRQRTAGSYTDDTAEAHRPRRPRKTALMTAVDLLARQEQSEQKLREKLARKGYEPEEIDKAVARLIEKHYLNDEDACARQFEFLYQESRSSVRQITIKLRQRGFDNNLIRECIPTDTFEREKAAALRVLAMKYKPSADRQKMMANLYSKGFDSSAIRAAVAEFAVDDSD